MFDDLDATLVLVVGVQLALAALLYLLARLEPVPAEATVAPVDDVAPAPR